MSQLGTRLEDQRAELLARLHDAVLAPDRLDPLLQLLGDLTRTGQIGPLLFSSPEMRGHLERAVWLLEGRAGSHRPAAPMLDGVERVAAMILDASGRLLAQNRAARVAFDLAEGAALAEFPFDSEARQQLLAQLRRLTSGGERGAGHAAAALRAHRGANGAAA